jgi:hypothetical protein
VASRAAVSASFAPGNGGAWDGWRGREFVRGFGAGRVLAVAFEVFVADVEFSFEDFEDGLTLGVLRLCELAMLCRKLG